MAMGARKPVAAGVLAVAGLAGVGCADRQPLCAENLHRIGRALHEYHDAENAFPRVAISDGEGRPGLSWRVAILPYLGRKALFEKFKLDEPWDGPHNKQLLGEMPEVFACPNLPRGDPSLTTYRGFMGKDAFFRPPYDSRHKTAWWTDEDGTKHYHPEPVRGLSMADFMDGTVNTLMVVEAKEAVPWTKPEGLPFDPDRADETLLGAGSPHHKGFNVLFVDGAVRFLPATVGPKAFRSLITRIGGEMVDPDAP
jgi:prepilin-type processing-associated H-X9-DG protein